MHQPELIIAYDRQLNEHNEISEHFPAVSEKKIPEQIL